MEITGNAKGIQSARFLDFKVRISRVPHELKEAVTQLHEYYIGEKQRTNDFKAIGPFILAALELKQ